MSETIELNNIAPEQIEKLIDMRTSIHLILIVL